ncbi:hypothetical protein OXX69_007218 [Metschnikowia pulcherrima]
MDYAYFGEFVLSKKWLFWLAFAYFILPFTVYLFVPFFIHRKSVLTRKTVTILVLGDLGHSPRMCYHALSFANLGFNVNLCGYIETAPPAAVIENVRIDVYPIQAIHNRKKLPYLAFALVKVVQQLFQLFQLLLNFRGNEFFVVQNPPSMPLLAVLIVFIKLFTPRSKLVIDWHNLNYSILNLRFKNLQHPLVRLMRLYERFLSRYAWLHITVTHQMKQFLSTEFGVKNSDIVTLHDRPGPQFTPISEAKAFESKSQHEVFAAVPYIENYKVLVTATSFTPDEDFDILLGALKLYHDSAISTPLFVLVTGKGPMKSQFLSRVAELAFSEKVIVKSAWLSAEDYPCILGVADLAVSLHTSSSGIDLPMKIVDFFGVGVPVVTLSFPAIGELVKDGVNGVVVKESENGAITEELYDSIATALGDKTLLATLKKGAMAESEMRWNENWIKVLAPVAEGH